jgi:tetratricopeptide (TPR) repeat protein
MPNRLFKTVSIEPAWQGASVLFRLLPFLFLSSLVSCTTIQKKPSTQSAVLPWQTVSEKVAHEEIENVPSPTAYFHVMRGLQFEEERSISTANNSDQRALAEYLTALKHDPESLFLLKRISVLHSRLEHKEDALRYAEKARALYPENGEILLLVGDMYMISGHPEKGLYFYEQSIQRSPETKEGYLKIAGIYADKRNFRAAEDIINKGLNAGSETPVAYYYLGRLAVERGKLVEGIQYFRQALALSPYFEPAHLSIAAILERQKKEKEAITVYKNVIKRINPGNQQAMGRLIQLLIRTRSLDEALNLLELLSSENPGNTDILLQKAHVLVQKKAFGQAIDVLLPIVNDRPDDLRLQIYLATLYEENNEVEQAVATYQNILDRHPDAYDVRIRLGYLYFYRLQNVSDALIQGEFAKEIDPNRAESYLFTGLILHDEARYRDAVDTFLDGIDVKPSLPNLHFHLGAALDKLNQFDEMVQAMEKTIELDAKHANALNYLGYTYANKGIELDQAIHLIKRALEIRPDDGYFIDSLAWAYFKKGQVQEALDLLQKAVSSVPDDPIIHEHLGEVHLKNNHSELARKAWERSLSLDPENHALLGRFKAAGFGTPEIKGIAQQIKDRSLDLPQETLK